MTPILSIITINYNNIDGLKKTIESVVTQTETDFEYIIIDGASTDGSSELIKEYAEHPEYGKKITHWVSEPDTGIYNAMNKGISKATGDYLHMLNSGDWYEPDALSCILPKLSKEKPDVLLCGINFWKNSICLKTEIRYEQTLTFGSLLHQGMLYKKNLHKEYGLYDEQYKYAADYDFCVKFYLSKNKKTSICYNASVNFSAGGLGESQESFHEFCKIQEHHKISSSKESKDTKIKKIIKNCLPFGIVTQIKKRREK